MAAGKRVTAIVLTYCNEAEAAACLESLGKSDYDALTVLLVDNASPDGSGDRLHARFPATSFLKAAVNGGYTAGNNRGIEWALARGSEYLLVLNDDTEIDRECVSRLVRAAGRYGCRRGGAADLVLRRAQYRLVRRRHGVSDTSSADTFPGEPTERPHATAHACDVCLWLLLSHSRRRVAGRRGI